jgi:uncharacterized membrane protein
MKAGAGLYLGSTAVRVVFALFLLLGAYLYDKGKKNPQEYEWMKYVGTFLVVIGTIIFLPSLAVTAAAESFFD